MTKSTWNYAELRDSTDKTYLLRFLPYIENLKGQHCVDLIGYGRRYAHGRYEECFRTREEALDRMKFLISVGAIEDAEILRAPSGSFGCMQTVDEWKDPTQSIPEEAT